MEIPKTKPFPIEEFQRIENIIFLDEPILTHLKRKDNDYLSYLVDTDIDNNIDVLLLFQVSLESLYAYLMAEISLRDLILQNNNFIYLLEQDFEGNIENYNVLSPNNIPNDYLPLEDSYLLYEPNENSYYYEYIQSNSYLHKLRQSAFYVKFESENSKYADTIGLTELSNDLLENLSKSYKCFLKADFEIVFKKYQTNENKLQSTFRKLEDDLDLRMVSLKYGSFEIGLAEDKIMKSSIEDKNIRAWAEDIGNKFKETVLNSDFSEERIDRILSNYSDDARRKIFKPLFKITENPNVSMLFKSSNQEPYTKLKIRDKSIIDKIIPSTPIDKDDEDKEYEIITITSVVNKKSKSKSIPLEGNLFSATDSALHILTKDDFEKYGYPINQNVHIPLNIKVKRNHIYISTTFEGEDFEVIEDSTKIEEGIKKMGARISQYYIELNL